jgi:hypothetical protein
MAQIRDDWRREFEAKGPDYVRSALDLGKFEGAKLDTARQWLGKKERDQELGMIAENRRRSNAALILSLIAIVVGVLSWLSKS